MPDFLTLLVFPLIVAVFALIIEYWIIHPLKSRQVENTENSSDENSQFSFAGFVRSIFLFSGVLAFLFSIFVILGTLKSDHNFFGSTINSVPFANLVENPVLSDVNLSFAAIIYTCIIFNVVGLQKNSPDWMSVFTLFVLPSALLLLWASVFLRENWFIYIICLLLSNIWVIGGLLFSRGEGQDYSTLAGVLSLIFFPTNALIFIYVVAFIPFVAWSLAIAVLIMDITIIVKLG